MTEKKKLLFDFYFKTIVDSVKSTNVKKIKWDTVTKDLTILFEDGSVYIYSNVPEAIFNNVSDGMAGTKTEGEWGPKGKYPSVGASINQILEEGGFSYRKGKTF